MGPVVQKATNSESTFEPTAPIRHPDVDATAISGGLRALNRLSATLSRVCALLSEHLCVVTDHNERRLLERVTTVAGDVFVAVRLSRFETQRREQLFGTSEPESSEDRGSGVLARLGEGEVGAVHLLQWTILESCYRFVAEWEDAEVHTVVDAERLRLATGDLARDIQTS
jgi:hypothetical protein